MTKYLQCAFCQCWFACEDYERRVKEHEDDPDACYACYQHFMDNQHLMVEDADPSAGESGQNDPHT